MSPNQHPSQLHDRHRLNLAALNDPWLPRHLDASDPLIARLQLQFHPNPPLMRQGLLVRRLWPSLQEAHSPDHDNYNNHYDNNNHMNSQMRQTGRRWDPWASLAARNRVSANGNGDVAATNEGEDGNQDAYEDANEQDGSQDGNPDANQVVHHVGNQYGNQDRSRHPSSPSITLNPPTDASLEAPSPLSQVQVLLRVPVMATSPLLWSSSSWRMEQSVPPPPFQPASIDSVSSDVVTARARPWSRSTAGTRSHGPWMSVHAGGGMEAESAADPPPCPPVPPLASLGMNGDGDESLGMAIAPLSRLVRDRASPISSLSSWSTSAAAQTLPFELVSCDGGEYGPAYSAPNVLRNDPSVYCSVRCRNVNLLFRYQPEECGVCRAHFYLSTLVFKAPSIGFTAPCKDVLVFVSGTRIDPADTKPFDNLSWRRFREQQRKRAAAAFSTSSASFATSSSLESSSSSSSSSSLSVSRAGTLAPIAFFRLTQRNHYFSVHHLTEPVTGRYVLVKLLRSDWEGPDMFANIDVQYIGFRGMQGKRAMGQGSLC